MILGLGLGVCAAQGLPQARYRVAGLDPELIGDFGAGVFAVNGQAMTFADLFDFSRLSAAWKVNALGHITHVPAGEPRTGHHIWKEGILVPAGVAVNSSNAVQYVPYASNPVGNWTDAVGIESADVDGGFVRLTHTGTNSLQRISVSVTASSSSVFTAQAEFREGTSGEAVLRVGGVDTGGAGESNVGFSYDFGTGVFSPRGGGAAYSAPVMAERSDGIYEMSFQFEATSVSNIQLAAAWNDDTAGLTVDFRNPQITETPYPQQFIPNATASQVTVAAETLSINQAKLSAALGGVMPDAVSIAIDGYLTYEDDDTFNTAIITNWTSNFDNRIILSMDTNGGNTGAVQFRTKAGGTAVSTPSTADAYSPGQNVPFSLAMRVGSGSDRLRGATDGVLSDPQSPTALPNLISAAFALADAGHMTIKSLRIWAEDFGDFGLVEATT